MNVSLPASCSIVLAEDDIDTAQATAALLRLAGCTVYLAHDGHSALLQIIEHAPQIAVLDLDMPILDGWALARTLRARGDMQGLQLIALTGHDQPADRAATAAAGFDQHLVKPATAAQLDAAIAHARDAESRGSE